MVKRTILLALASLSGCQLHPSTPTAQLTLPGNYKTIAECSFLAIRTEGMWKKDDYDSMNTVRLTLGTRTYDVGRIDFAAGAADTTDVTFLIAHHDKYTPKVRACAGVSP